MIEIDIAEDGSVIRLAIFETEESEPIILDLSPEDIRNLIAGLAESMIRASAFEEFSKNKSKNMQ